MTESAVLAYIVQLGVLLGVAFGIWRYFEARIRASEIDAATRIGAAVAQSHLIAASLSDFKIYVAENYVTKQGIREIRDEIMTGVKDLKGSVSNLHDRIDAIILNTRDRQ